MTRFFVDLCEGNGGFFWKLRSRNGETLAHSEIYKTKRKRNKTAYLVGAGWTVEECKIRENCKTKTSA